MAYTEETDTGRPALRGGRLAVLTGSTLLLVALVAVSVSVGATDVTPAAALSVLAAGPGDSTAATIVWQIRVPRVLSAVVVGAGLAVSGAVMQGVLDNPLGSPYTLGISHAAMFGAAAAIMALGAAGTDGSLAVFGGPYAVTLAAFAASMLSTLVILGLATCRRATPETMILTGVALGSLFTAGTTALQYVATGNELSSIVYWSFGDVGRTTWPQLLVLTAVVVPATAYVVAHAWEYNALDAGDATALGLGVDVAAVRAKGMLLASLVTAIAVSFVGIVGFVGLVVPHVVRKLVGDNKQYLLPTSSVVGAVLLLGSDTLARTALAPTVVPVGIVTSFVGAPFFIYLVVRGREHWTQ